MKNSVRAVIDPPEKENGEWKTEFILEGQIGEIATADLDGDGIEEIMTIEPFHGNRIQIYKKEEDG